MDAPCGSNLRKVATPRPAEVFGWAQIPVQGQTGVRPSMSPALSFFSPCRRLLSHRRLIVH